MLHPILRPILQPILQPVVGARPRGGVPTQVATPTFSPSAGEYGPTQNVTLSTSTPGASIYYTTNGDTPTALSTLYTVPIEVPATTTIKAIAIDGVLTDSAVSTGLFTINGAVATPTFSPVAGTYGSAQDVTISTATSGASLFYTTNGDTPTSGSTPYTAPVNVPATGTLKAIGIKAGWSNSAVGSAAYNISAGSSVLMETGDALLLETGDELLLES